MNAPDQLTERDVAEYLDHNPQVEARAILCRGKTLKAHEVIFLCITARAPRVSPQFGRELFRPLVDRIMLRWAAGPGQEKPGIRLGSREIERSCSGPGADAAPVSSSLSRQPEPGPAGGAPRIVQVRPLDLVDCEVDHA